MTAEEEKMSRSLTLFKFLEPAGQCHAIDGNPTRYFPDTKSARWMLSLLLSSQDVGLAQKLLEPFLLTKNAQNELLDQYRSSHRDYFLRLLCAHSYEAWLVFNKEKNDDIVLKIKANDEIKQIYQKICDKFSFKSGKDRDALTVVEVLEKCRHVAFHYYEEDGDLWGKKLNSLGQTLAVGIGDCEAD